MQPTYSVPRVCLVFLYNTPTVWLTGMVMLVNSILTSAYNEQNELMIFQVLC